MHNLIELDNRMINCIGHDVFTTNSADACVWRNPDSCSDRTLKKADNASWKWIHDDKHPKALALTKRQVAVGCILNYVGAVSTN